MLRGFRYRLYPTAEQADTLSQWVGVTRLVYNLALEQRRDFWRQYRANEGRNISFASQSRELTELRPLYDFIGEPPRTCLEQALRDLDKAFASFFAGRSGFPGWRRAGVHDSIRCKAIDARTRKLNARWSEVLVPKLGWVRFRSSRAHAGEHLNVTIRRESGDWFVALTCDIGEGQTESRLPTVGVDRGIANTVSLSTGEHFTIPASTRLDRRTKAAQRALARRKKGSRRRAIQKARVAHLRAKSARIRQHWAHVLTSRIASRFGVVALEELNLRAMTASAAGTASEPGSGVRQKSGLNRSILNQGWGQIATFLEYKLEAAGGRLVYVPAAFTSQTCSACGVVDRASRKSQAVFACVHCGHEAHADTNAALEIQRRSTALLRVEGGHLGPPVEVRTLAA